MLKKLLFIFLIISSISYSQQSYYNGIDFNKTGLALKNDLATLIINTHTNTLSYGEVWTACKATDENPDNTSEVLLIYGYSSSGITAKSRSKNLNGGNVGDWNREHTYAKSNGTPNLGTSGAGADAHHLRASDVQFNGQRGSKKFADGSGNAGNSNGGWYPGDEWKGDVARMMMYMYLRYPSQCVPGNNSQGSSSSTPDSMVDLFLKWNAEDPPSTVEKQRNTYHDSSSNSAAQGNRNPFIDNPRLATIIWGGQEAEDTWGIFSNPDTEAPTVPTNISISNITLSSFTITWDASTDNNAVTSYDIYLNGNFKENVTNTSTTVNGLTPNTNYSVTVLAKDAANNSSSQSTAVNATTLEDTIAPTVPTNVTVSNQTGTTFQVNWTQSTDNVAVKDYEIFIDGNLKGTSLNTQFNVTGLTVSTTYTIEVLAKDESGNSSAKSTSINGTTTDGTNPVNELFFSEYIEGSSSNKAIEIANFTGQTVSLANYSVKLASNGANFGSQTLTFTNETIANGDVFVIGNSSIAICTSEVDVSSNVTFFGGNDALGLFKNDVLIDVIGTEGNTNDFGKDVTLIRKPSVTGPNTTYTPSEWNNLSKDDCSDLGSHNVATASIFDQQLKTLKIFPNPITDNKIVILNPLQVKIKKISLFSLIGKKVFQTTTIKNNQVNFSKIKTGIYLLRINSSLGNTTRKIIIK
ncbi:MAG: endonuclease [Flavobacteriaceae bacterium]